VAAQQSYSGAPAGKPRRSRPGLCSRRAAGMEHVELHFVSWPNASIRLRPLCADAGIPAGRGDDRRAHRAPDLLGAARARRVLACLGLVGEHSRRPRPARALRRQRRRRLSPAARTSRGLRPGTAPHPRERRPDPALGTASITPRTRADEGYRLRCRGIAEARPASSGGACPALAGRDTPVRSRSEIGTRTPRQPKSYRPPARTVQGDRNNADLSWPPAKGVNKDRYR
jgi:hypothetical protein